MNESVTSQTVVSDDAALVEDDLLVEEVSIDGMCGVY
ncbi:mycofactocin precursor MftA [Nocardia sp. BMG51109]|nr:mycofactocin precursor MftA [Nocardia sp. BMG51109]